MSHKTGGQRPVDNAMIVGERQRQHETRPEALAIPYRRHFRTDHAQYGDLRRVNDGGEGVPADAAEARDGERGALHVRWRELAIARLLGDSPKFLAEFRYPL